MEGAEHDDEAAFGAFSAAALRQIFGASPSAMVLVAPDGVIRLANAQAERLFRYAPGTLAGVAVEALVPERYRGGHAAQRAGYFRAPVVRAMGEGRDLFGSRADGSEVPIEIGLTPIHIGDAVFVLAAIIDITARRRSEEVLRGSLQEKEMLLREVHHRVKNNLQVVSSLLSLQAANVHDAEHRALFEECQTRVRTMALVHEKLYATGNLARLEGAEYLRDLVRMLARTYAGDRTGIRVDLHVGPVVLDLHVAIPVGLILHEWVANAWKHAFAGRTEGVLRVDFDAVAPGRLRLVVADDGPGLPADFDVARVRGLGVRMVQGLVRQLDGEWSVARDGGARFTLEFGVAAAKEAT